MTDYFGDEKIKLLLRKQVYPYEYFDSESKRKRDILFHVVWYTFELFPLYFANGLHDKMGVISSCIMYYHRNTTNIFIVNVTPIEKTGLPLRILRL
jgi:hypothetical protein